MPWDTAQPWRRKDPDEVKVIVFDFSRKASPGSSLSAPNVTATPSGLTIGAPSVSGLTVLALVGGGADGLQYELACEVRQDNGEVHLLEKYLRVSVKGALVL